MLKQVVEPMLDSMLPGPLSTLRFTKIDFGTTPIKLSNVEVHKTKLEGIKLDMDLEWDGLCDIELEGKMVPKVVSCHHSPSANIEPPSASDHPLFD
jgi:hypothetical protein